MLKKIYTLLVLISLFNLTSFAQNSTDIIAIDVKKSGLKMELIPETETKITDRKGYDNQPNFINDKQLAFSSADENGNFDFSVVIRSIIADLEAKKLYFGVGSAITIDASAEQEYEECELKAQALFELLRGN